MEDKFLNKIHNGDVLKILKKFPDESIDCIVTSPPYYGLRDYGIPGQIGLEPGLPEYLDKMLDVTLELKRVLKKTGTMWWNHGDSYSSAPTGSLGNQENTDGVYSRLYKRNSGGSPRRKLAMPEKSLALQAHRLAIRMIDEQNWILRNTIIWHKPNCMPSSVKDRFTVDYEPVFFFTKSKKYWFEQQFEVSTTRNWANFNMRVRDVKRGKVASDQYKASEREIGAYEGGEEKENQKRSMRSVWRIPTKPLPEAHFAVFPELVVETPIKAGCPPNGIVLDPFMGAGTTALVARQLKRNFIGIEISKEYIEIAKRRLKQKILI